MSLKALRERMNDGNYATLAEAVRVLLDDLIARTHPTAGTAGHTVRAEAVPVDVPKTNQGGGGDAAGTASPDARTDSAAADALDERVERLCKEADHLMDDVGGRSETETWLAARCLRAEDEVTRLKEYGDRVAAELQERSIEAAALGADVRRLTASRDALKAALDEERKQAEPMVAACRSIVESLKASLAYSEGLDVHVVNARDAQRMIAIVDAFDARRASEKQP